MNIFEGKKEIMYGGLPYIFKGSVDYSGNEHSYKGKFFEHNEKGEEVLSDLELDPYELAEALNLDPIEYMYDEMDRISDLNN